MTNKIWEMSALEAHGLLKRKKNSAKEILESSIERIEEIDGDLNALPEKCFDRARKLAVRIDNGLFPRTPTDLLGLPIAVKDYNDLSGVTKDVDAGEQVAGFPATSSRQFWRDQAVIRRLSKSKSSGP